MIKAYLAGIASQYEGESIEVRYSVYEDQELLFKESEMLEYRKPAIVGQIALITLLKKLKKYMDKEIVIIINDPVLYEVVRGTLTTNNRDILKMTDETRKEFDKLRNAVIKDISYNHVELKKWNEVLWP